MMSRERRLDRAMTSQRLHECLRIIRWSPDALAEALGCDISLVLAWLENAEEVPIKTGAWIETLATAHAAAEAVKPASLRGKRFRGEA